MSSAGDRLRETGISVIDSLPWGSHFCQFYQTKDDLLDVVASYLKAGLENGEFCVWVTSEPVTVDEARQALRAIVPEVDHHLTKGNLEILPHTEWYLKDGFDRQRVLNSWKDKLNQAMCQGYTGVRVTGDTMWLEKSHWDDFREYEASINDCIKDQPLLVLCTYNLDKCGASEIADVISNHEFALIKRDGQWTVIESSEHRQMEEKIRYQNAILEGINRIFRESLTCSTEEELGRICLSIAEEVTMSKFGFIGEINADGRLNDIAISDPGWDACKMDNPVGHQFVPTGLEIVGIYGRVILDGRGFFTNDPASHPDSIGVPEGHPGLESFLSVPLTHLGKTIGMIGLGNRDGGYREEDMEALEALGAAIVQVFMRQRAEQEREELLKRERHIAETLRQAIIPSGIPKTIANCRLAAAYQPASREAEIGGDFYDVFQIDEDRYGIIIGDVVGKGVGAAVRVAAARYSVRSYAILDPRPGRVLSLVNDALCRGVSDTSNFMTIFFGVLDTKTRVIHYVSAGHEPPVVLTCGQDVEELDISGLPLGVVPNVTYSESILSLLPGHRLVMVTDGVIESRTSTSELYSKERLIDCLRRHSKSSPDEFVAALMMEANAHAGGRTQDDAAIVVIDVE